MSWWQKVESRDTNPFKNTPTHIRAAFNPLTLLAISKLLEMISRSTYILACSIAASSGGRLSM